MGDQLEKFGKSVLLSSLNYLVEKWAQNAQRRQKVAAKISSGETFTLDDLGLEDETDQLIAEGEALNPEG